MKKITTLSISLFLLQMLFWSNSLSAQQNLYTETFDYPQGELPTGWVIDAAQPPEWGVNVSQIAGGTAPELYMGYGFQVGLSRLVSSPIDIDGHDKLALRYKQYLINYAADAGEVIGLDVTFDDGATWQPLWEAPLWLFNIPQDEYVYYFNAPAGATEMKFAFRYDGNNNFINGWAIDDVEVEAVIDNDLLARSISGNTTPNIGQNATYDITVENGGTITQNNYTVSIVNENGDVVAFQAGDPIAFAETKTYTLSWTPGNADLGGHTFIAKVESADDAVLTNNETADFLVSVQYQDTEDIHIGDGIYPATDSPLNFFYLHSLAQTLYKAEDITATGETINGLEYRVYFDNDTDDVPIQIYLGETTEENMENAWVDPSSFTLVYEGMVNFQKGFNNIYIPFDTAYEYTGDNLVVYSNKSYPEQILWTGFYNTPDQNTAYSRVVYGDDQPFDAMNPPNGFPRYEVPNITLFFSSGVLAVNGQDLDTNAVVLYPNPVTNVLHIQTTEPMREIRILNTLGQQVRQEKVGDTLVSLNIEELSSGMYLVQIVTDKGISSKKIQVK